MMSAGRDSGSRMRQKNPNVAQPSIAAASSSSTGMARMNGRRMMIVIGSPNAASGSATPSSDSQQAELPQQEVERQGRDGDREQQAEREERVDRLAAAELVAARAERGERADADDEHGRDRRDERAVADLTPEGAGRDDLA